MPQIVVGLTPAQGRRFIPGYSEPGWTIFTATPDPANNGTRIIYVSNSSGDDKNCGYKPDLTGPGCPAGFNHTPPTGGTHGPKKTISAGAGLIRDGKPDWLLLRRGDTWNLSDTFSISWNGPNASEKILISSYPDTSIGQTIKNSARPKITVPIPNQKHGIGCSSHSNVAIVDLHVEGINGVDIDYGCGILVQDSTNILVEGCYSYNFMQGMAVQWCTNALIRRNVVHKANNTGLYHNDGVNNIYEENIFYHIGAALQGTGKSGHGFYCSQGTNPDPDNLILRRNIVSDSHFNAFDLRASPILCEDNFVARCKNAADIGGGPGWISQPNGVASTFRRNCIVSMKPPFGDSSDSAFAWLKNINGATVQDNIYANGEASAAFQILRLMVAEGGTPPNEIGKIQNLTISGNTVYGAGGIVVDMENIGLFSNLTLANNEFNINTAHDLIRIDNAAHASGWTDNSNRFWSQGAGNGTFRIGGVLKNLTDYQAAVPGDNGSLIIQMSYPKPQDATTAKYDASLYGGAGSHDHLMGELIKMRKGNWQLALTTDYMNKYVRTTCFGKP